MEEQIKAMEKLGMTEGEIAEVLDSDRRIDKGEKLFDLPKELEQGSKKARQADRKAETAKRQTTKKENPDKREIMDTLDDALYNLVNNVKKINPERELEFIYNDVKYKLTLSCPRK